MERENYGPIDRVGIIEEMIGVTFRMVAKTKDDDELHFITADGMDYVFYHEQDCCESVTIEDIAGNLDDLCDSPITMAEEIIHESMEDEWLDSVTYTFYKFATVKGYVTVRWCGSSNGYYSESVYFKVQPLSAN